MRAHEISVSEQTSWRGESKSALTIFVKLIFDLFFQNIFPNNVRTKIVRAEWNSPLRILLCRGLKSFCGVLVCSGIDFLVISGSQADMRTLNNIHSEVFGPYFRMKTVYGLYF